jgi:hypothetical protein
VFGSLASQSIQSIDCARARVTLGLRQGSSGGNTSAAFVTDATNEEDTWFGLFVGQDDDERSIFASAAAALACHGAVSTLSTAPETGLLQLIEVAQQAIVLIQNERVPAELELGSNFAGVTTRLTGLAVSGCIGRLSASGFELVRLGACSVLNLETGSALIDADLMLEGMPNRYLAPYQSGFGLPDPKFRQTEVLVAAPQTAVCACSLQLQEALLSEEGRYAFDAATAAGDWAPLDPALDATTGSSSCAFLVVDPRAV